MTDLTKNQTRLAYVDWLKDIYRHHPSMRQVEILKRTLAKVFYGMIISCFILICAN
jgi:hypothetical protein